MFETIETNRRMILGAYRKLKSYYFYDKSNLFNKVQLSTWENIEQMDKNIQDLATFMTSINQELDQIYLSNLLKRIQLIPVPKAFKQPNDSNDILQFTNTEQSPLESVNFFIKAPVELMILDAIWMLLIGKIATDNHVLSNNAYANRVKAQVYSESDNLMDGIDFDSNRLFIPYFKQYTAWRNNAFSCVQQSFSAGHDSLLISLDLRSYYYSTRFKFSELPGILKGDSRLQSISPLTRIIEVVYCSYTAEMKKYRNDIEADCKLKECILPIGLFSSMLLSNLILADFDSNICSRIAPQYYGRYVDDIMLVIKDISRDALDKNKILENTFVRTGILRPDKGDYTTVLPAGLHLQDKKVRCIYFDHNESDAVLKLMHELCHITPSGIDLMPDISISKKSFHAAAYSLGGKSGVLKVRDFLFSSDNFAATLFVNDLIKTSKNVDITEQAFKKHIQDQISEIKKFYNGSKAVEYRSAWLSVFSLMIINKEYSAFADFYWQLSVAIDQMKSSSLMYINESKFDHLFQIIKENMHNYLNIVLSSTLAPASKCDLSTIESELARCGVSSEIITSIIYNACDLRNANMFNHHVISYPLTNYIMDSNSDSGEISLIEATPQNIASSPTSQNEILPLNKRKIDLSPRFIHLDELCLLHFLLSYPQGGDPFFSKLNALLKRFQTINHLSSSLSDFCSSQSNQASSDTLNLNEIDIRNSENPEIFEDFHIAIASIKIDPATDVIPTIKQPEHGASYSKKRKFYTLLNEAVDKNVNMVVFPELFLPYSWLEEILAFCRKHEIAVITGLHYMLHDKNAYNYLCIIQPFVTSSGYKYALPLIREKNYYAPLEKAKLSELGYTCHDSQNSYAHLIKWHNLHYSDVMCYELTNIKHRASLCGKIELLVVPELNQDTAYFSNIVESACRDLHTFIVQVNTSLYGDSRITGPYNTLFKDIVKIKGGECDILLVGTIKLKDLMDCRTTLTPARSVNEVRPRLKQPPAGFTSRKEESNP